MFCGNTGYVVQKLFRLSSGLADACLLSRYRSQIAGAFQAVRNASPDDSIFEEAAGFLQALARDATIPRGLLLVTWDQETFNGLTDALGRVGIPRDWVVDMVSYDAVELIGASLGVLIVYNAFDENPLLRRSSSHATSYHHHRQRN